MRERRSAVRVQCALPVQYSPTNRLSAFTGRLTDVSVRGLRLSTRHPLERGTQLSTRLLLPGEDDPVIVNGLVRWSSSNASKRGEYEAGIELTNIDDTTHFCLQSFVTSRLQGALTAGRFVQGWRTGKFRPALRASAWIASGLLSAGVVWWIVTSERQKAELRESLAEHTIMLENLQVQRQALQQELGQAKLAASDAITEIGRLQAERTQLETQIGWMARNLSDLKQAYARVRDEREDLHRQVVELEQRFQSIPELRKAMRAAVRAQREVRHRQRVERITQLRAADQDTLKHGNRGYVLQAGTSTITGSPRLAVRVYPPELTDQPNP